MKILLFLTGLLLVCFNEILADETQAFLKLNSNNDVVDSYNRQDAKQVYWRDNEYKTNGVPIKHFDYSSSPSELFSYFNEIEDQVEECRTQWVNNGCLNLYYNDNSFDNAVLLAFSNDPSFFVGAPGASGFTAMAVTYNGDDETYNIQNYSSESLTDYSQTAIILNNTDAFEYIWTVETGSYQGEMQFKNILLHEMGHLVGLGHRGSYVMSEPEFVMTFGRPYNHPLFTLTQGDKDGLAELCSFNGTPTGIEDGMFITEDLTHYDVGYPYVGHIHRTFQDEPPYGDYIVSWDDWQIKLSYGCSEVLVYQSATSDIYITSVPGGYLWERDENGYVIGTLSTGGIDNDGIHHTASLPIKISNVPNTFITSGTLSSDTYWCGDLTITGNITVPSGKKLTILPSANITFQNNSSLIVNGILDASFAYLPYTTFDFVSPNSSTQNGIKINNGGDANISHAIIKNAYRGVYIADNRPSISNSEFIDCFYGIYLDNTNYGGYNQSYLTDNKIHGSDIGIIMYTSGPYITGNEIYNNRIAVGAAENSKPYLGYAGSYGSNNIHDNDYGVFAFDYSDPFLGRSTCTIQGGNNSITSSDNYAIYAYNYCDIVAENNWWGSSSPSSSLFRPGNGGTIDYNPWLSQLPNLNLMISDRSNSPEEKAFNVAFKSQSSNTNYLMTSVNETYSYNKDWPLRWKLYYVRNLIDVRKTKFAAKICKEIILQNPDSSLSFSALNLLWRASANDGYSFKEFLTQIAAKNKANNVELYSLAELILANNYNTSDKITKLDNIIGRSNKTRIVESALVRKFLYYVNSKKDFSAAGVVADEISQRFPNSIILQEINRQLNGPDNNLISLKKSKTVKETQISKEYSLLGNYPNPFNPSTKIRYALPFDSDVEVTIYNINGELVKAFKYGSQSAGLYDVKWNGTNSNNEQVSSGIYLYHFKAKSLEKNNEVFEKSAKLILMK